MKNEKNVLEWAENKGILNPDNLIKQALKLGSECGEFQDEVCKGDTDKAINELGDVLVVSSIAANQLGVDLEHCLELAYNKISKRKGKTVNGTFIKNTAYEPKKGDKAIVIATESGHDFILCEEIELIKYDFENESWMCSDYLGNEYIISDSDFKVIK